MPSRFTSYARALPQFLSSRGLAKKYDCLADVWEVGCKVAKEHERILLFDCAKQMLTLSFLLKSLKIKTLSEGGIRNVCIIGDGYGYMGSLIRKFDPKINVIGVNLGRTLFFDVFYTQKSFPHESAVLFPKKDSKSSNFMFLEAENYKLLDGLPIDLFINIASMQEMSQEVIVNYFHYMRNSSSVLPYFYCCNRLEKTLPCGEVVKLENYPWRNTDQILIDELCPWYQKFPTNYPPFWKHFDGPIGHRLVRLGK